MVYEGHGAPEEGSEPTGTGRSGWPEGVSIWVVPSASISASDPDAAEEFFDPAVDKAYRHPTFYTIPDEVGHM